MKILEFVRRTVQRQIQSMLVTTGLLILKDQETRKLKEKEGAEKEFRIVYPRGVDTKIQGAFSYF